MSVFDWAVECVLHHEGGFVFHPDDPGGATNYGISLRYLVSRGDLDGDGLPDGDLDGDGDVDVDDIRHATRFDARELYYTGFWKPIRASEIKSGLISTKFFDMAVNMGSRQATRLLQRACNNLGSTLKDDGAIGPNTLKAVNSYLSKDYQLLDRLRVAQAEFYETLIKRKPSLGTFRLGWRRRASF